MPSSDDITCKKGLNTCNAKKRKLTTNSLERPANKMRKGWEGRGQRSNVEVVQRESPYIAWPAYEYTSDHIANLSAKCSNIFQRCSLAETTEGHILEKRLSCAVTINVLYCCSQEKEQLEEIFIKEVENLDSEYCEDTRRDISLENLQFQLKRSSEDTQNLAPVFFLLPDIDLLNDLKFLQEVCLNNPRFHCLVVHKRPSSKNLQKGMLINVTTERSIFKDIDKLLKYYSFDVISSKVESLQCCLKINLDLMKPRTRQICTELCAYTKSQTLEMFKLKFVSADPETPNQDNTGNIISEIEALLRNIKMLYNRCGIEATKYLKNQVDIPNIDNETLRQILSIDPQNILRCGVAFGQVHIQVNDEADASVRASLEEVIRKKLKGIKHITYYTNKEFKLFAAPVCIGVPVEKSGRFGTLGCFAKHSEKGLCAVISKHVAEEFGTFDNVIRLGSEINGHLVLPHSNLIDIAAVQILPTDRRYVDAKFRDEHDRVKDCKLFEYINRQIEEITLHFNLVFIHGAKTRTGKGEIVQWSNIEEGTVLHIKNRSDTPADDFCTEGDSGSIICAKNEEGKIFALAILIGQEKNEPNYFVAHMLEEGFRSLNTAQHASITLCQAT